MFSHLTSQVAKFGVARTFLRPLTTKPPLIRVLPDPIKPGKPFEPKNILPSLAELIESIRASLVPVDGRDDQQSRLKGLESYPHQLKCLKLFKEVHEPSEIGGPAHHAEGGTVPACDLRRFAMSVEGTRMSPFEMTRDRCSVNSAYPLMLTRNGCGWNMEEVPTDVLSKAMEKYTEAGVRGFIVFDAANRPYAIAPVAAKAIRQGASVLIANAVSQDHEDPLTFNPWAVLDFYDETIDRIIEEFEKLEQAIPSNLVDHLCFYLKDPSGGGIVPWNAEIYAEVITEGLRTRFGEENSRVLGQVHATTGTATWVYEKLIKKGLSVEVAQQFPEGNAHPQALTVVNMMEDLGYQGTMSKDGLVKVGKFGGDIIDLYPNPESPLHTPETLEHLMAGGGQSIAKDVLGQQGRLNLWDELKRTVQKTRRDAGNITQVTPFDNDSIQETIRRLTGGDKMYPGYMNMVVNCGLPPSPQNPEIVKEALLQKAEIFVNTLAKEQKPLLDRSTLESIIDVMEPFWKAVEIPLRIAQLEQRIGHIEQIKRNPTYTATYNKQINRKEISINGTLVRSINDIEKAYQAEIEILEKSPTLLLNISQEEYCDWLRGQNDDLDGTFKRLPIIRTLIEKGVPEDVISNLLRNSVRIFGITESENLEPGMEKARQEVAALNDEHLLGLEDDILEEWSITYAMLPFTPFRLNVRNALLSMRWGEHGKTEALHDGDPLPTPVQLPKYTDIQEINWRLPQNKRVVNFAGPDTFKNWAKTQKKIDVFQLRIEKGYETRPKVIAQIKERISELKGTQRDLEQLQFDCVMKKANAGQPVLDPFTIPNLQTGGAPHVIDRTATDTQELIRSIISRVNKSALNNRLERQIRARKA